MFKFTNLLTLAILLGLSGIVAAQDDTKPKRQKKSQGSDRSVMRMTQQMNAAIKSMDFDGNQKKEIRKIMREHQQQVKKMREQATGVVADPDLADRRREFVKSLRQDGASKEEIRDAVKKEFPQPKMAKMSKEVSQKFRDQVGKLNQQTRKKIFGVLSEDQRNELENLIKTNAKQARKDKGKEAGQKKAGKQKRNKKKSDDGDGDR